ncbi:sigma-54-dependent Fis family transcriptional regulator [Sporosarcina sp. ANT_H38]|uniref:sigma-54-dependent transcriptional regulator n=1 Tax=Sporosarcina sp. ANT_H38 TaxID=2597358 RepID=UPI0011F2B66E|nr:sigma-54 dependent transcriptional regulator [Sporosarcina sp. ANT_H38]KAA0965687.1 sigma-54-dependent Fis family transcriptional regulator [Sporosarcina sp. ANT_H38]
MTHILVVEDEVELGRFLSRLFALKGFKTTHVKSGKDFDQISDFSPFKLAFIDVRLPDRSGIEILKMVKTTAPHIQCVIMTGYSTVKIAVDAIKHGAADFIEKPFEDINVIDQLIDGLLGNQKSVLPKETDYQRIAREIGCFLGTSRSMHQLYQLAYKIAPKRITVLIEGETGTGKEVLAKFLHAASDRPTGSLMNINCGALSESLLESELFGHVKGAFTGALTDRAGYFEAASSGTLFLDEIAEASVSTQVKLLRVLETGEYIKIGGTSAERTSARIIAASHVNLEEAVQRGSFREDLLYRLDIVKLVIPPLRERREDIPLLIDSLLKRYGESILFSPETVERMKLYDWPGNMRELSNIIRQIAAISTKGSVITPDLLPPKITGLKQLYPAAVSKEPLHFPDEWKLFSEKIMSIYNEQEQFPLEELLALMKSMEKRTAVAMIKKSLHETAGNRKETSENLGISRRKIRYYLNET